MSMDDAPTFSQRIAELELDSYKLKFQELGIDTHSKFAYVTTYTPGADAQIFTQEVVEPIAGERRTSWSSCELEASLHRKLLDGCLRSQEEE